MGRDIDDSKQFNTRGLDVCWQEDIDVPLEGCGEGRACLKSGDDNFLCPVRARMICENIHDRWKDNTIPSTLMAENVRYGYFAADTLLETFDDPDDRIFRILVTQPDTDHIKLSIPVHLSLSNIFAGSCMTLRSPMGVQSRIALTAPVIVTGSTLAVPFSGAVVNVERLDGKCLRTRSLIGAPYGREDANYRFNRQKGILFGFDLDTLLAIHLVSCGRDFATDIGDIHITIPDGSKITT